MITVKYIGGVNPKSISEIWGGSKATFNAFVKSFENDTDVKIIYKARDQFLHNNLFDLHGFNDFIKDADIVHVDDTTILGKMFENNLPPPDVIGPISRSPIKVYKDNWVCPYTKDWFYQSKIIRLNYNEERKNHGLVTLIHHGIDTNFLIPQPKHRKYVLWAGMIPRAAKNYPLMEEIMRITTLPLGFEWKIMSQYNVSDYWNTLDETAILINTSKSESFCCALFEARAKGVATIQPVLLNGKGIHENAPIQVQYNAESYKEKILDLLSEEKFIQIGNDCRAYCVETASLKQMRDSFYKIYLEVFKNK
jgi:hypothetical protein